ncbi:carboxypeptidase-like regulatory domain-containing protein [uncultured Hymenobacter sp.]|uniref:carboxypeptidase-like regulatory domain-containing protein n=1 Tax=uncultured Hymenobacter sp. TaxID=170016 RepID=UPI0035C97C05
MQRLVLLPLVTMGLISTAQAQTRSVTGQVVRADKSEPLVGVTVVEKGTSNGISTDAEGRFSLSVTGNQRVTRVISYIGYKSQEVQAAPDQARLDVRLAADAAALDEVVVIGYGTVKKRDLTGSVYSVKSDDIVQTPTHNAVEAIQGRVPGADIVRSSGAAGANSTISIRGTRSINSAGSGQASSVDRNGPLTIIDGFQGGNISDLNPNDIESIEVLKDASSTAIYGA